MLAWARMGTTVKWEPLSFKTRVFWAVHSPLLLYPPVSPSFKVPEKCSSCSVLERVVTFLCYLLQMNLGNLKYYAV
jgi:hypothetical protein